MKYVPIPIALLFSVLLAACGNDDASPVTDAGVTEAEPATPVRTPTPLAAAPTTIGTASESAPAAETVAAAGNEDGDGKAIYDKNCALCHAAGVAGAPIPGHEEHWGPRIAKGKDTLYMHAIEGYTGEKGVMPARGGNPNLDDEAVKAAVDYMVQQSP